MLHKVCMTQRKSVASVPLSIQWAEDWPRSANSDMFSDVSSKWLPVSGGVPEHFDRGTGGHSVAPVPRSSQVVKEVQVQTGEE